MIKDTIQAVKAMFQKKRLAYVRTFNMDNADAKIVLKDLARFCRGHESTYHADPRLNLVLEGRKEVWLRIQNYLNLGPEELYQLHRVKEMTQGEKRE